VRLCMMIVLHTLRVWLQLARQCRHCTVIFCCAQMLLKVCVCVFIVCLDRDGEAALGQVVPGCETCYVSAAGSGCTGAKGPCSDWLLTKWF
jgi:hypothetical protein